jgi:hypothetical protein
MDRKVEDSKVSHQKLEVFPNKIKLYFFSLFIYSDVHTLFGPFLPPAPFPLPLPPTPLASRQKLVDIFKSKKQQVNLILVLYFI